MYAEIQIPLDLALRLNHLAHRGVHLEVILTSESLVTYFALKRSHLEAVSKGMQGQSPQSGQFLVATTAFVS